MPSDGQFRSERILLAVNLQTLEISEVRTISIIGCGRVGTAAARFFLNKGFLVRAVSRSPLQEPIEHPAFKFYREALDENSSFLTSAELSESDFVLICLPPSAGLGVFEQIAQALSNGLRQILLISSTSVYGDLIGPVKEGDEQESITEPRSKRQLEIERLFIRGFSNVTILRCGGLVGPGRHPGRFFSSGVGKGNGIQPVNMIDERDVIRAIHHLASNSNTGVYNCVFPSHPSRREYYTEAARTLGLENVVFEETTAGQPEGKVVLSEKLVLSGFQFEYDIENFSRF